MRLTKKEQAAEAQRRAFVAALPCPMAGMLYDQESHPTELLLAHDLGVSYEDVLFPVLVRM